MSGMSIANQISKWSEGVPSEASFWSMWLRTKGAEWPDDFRFRLDPDSQISAFVGSLLPDRSAPQILDVGAGPMTCLGKKSGGRTLLITACDPLAPIYTELLNSAEVNPIVRTEQAFAEDLSLFYDINRFDIVHCRNALDHSFDPLRGVQEMLLVTAMGGYVVLEHAADEAEHARYDGLHQWNFNVENDRFVIWNRSQKLFLDEHVADCQVEKMQKNGRMITIALRKLRASSSDVVYQRTRARAREFAYTKG